MKEVWSKIIDFWSDKISIEGLGEEIRSEDFELIEYHTKQVFPKRFKDFYKIHNGCQSYTILPHLSRLLSIEEIIKEWDILNKQIPEYDNQDCLNVSKEVKKKKWHSSWIPFAISIRGRDYYCLDFDPTDFAYIRQVIFYSIDLGDREFISTSFENFIKDSIEGIMDGKYKW